MRKSAKDGPLSVKAVSGTHVVVLGINLGKDQCPGLLGFAIHRSDLTEDEAYWLKGQKRFPWAKDLHVGGRELSTRLHPVQSFLWQDFTAKPEHEYKYRVVEIRGDPKSSVEGRSATVKIKTEGQASGTHRIFFNRGAISSQKYAEEFQNQNPRAVGAPAWNWLSRGLFEALKGFIDGAGPGDVLRAALYETEEPQILRAFRAAAERGADVRIVFDDRENQEIKDNGVGTGKFRPKEPNETALREAGILDTLCVGRTKNKSNIAHNKFIVFGKKSAAGKVAPKEVWTGSTNITESGIFGHLNVGHIVRDAGIAEKYIDYWTELSGDPEGEKLAKWTVENSPIDQNLASGKTLQIFSPRARPSKPSSLDWYVEMMDKARKASFLTGAFGLPKAFVPVLEKKGPGVRYVLLDSYGKGTLEQVEKRKKLVSALRKNSFNKIVLANLLRQNAFDNWLAETLNPISTNVRYLHTKFLLADPLSEDPWVVTGSANFSDDSTFAHDENMLVIRGDTRVADIYLTEFMRLYRHYVFREWAATNADQAADVPFLDTTDRWWGEYFKPGNLKSHQREYFAA
jgi:phosphatidylserine/phosphatidylglycerophosphate/cardiolipin synthase-like enzyme